MNVEEAEAGDIPSMTALGTLLHCARPVTKGEKYILSQRIHDRPFKA